MRIIGFDPGKVTGVSVVHVLEEEVVLEDSWQLTKTDLIYFLRGLVPDNFDKITYESFILRRGQAYTSDQVDPCYIIGALEFWAQPCFMHPVTPAQNKSGVTDVQLEKLGLTGPPGDANRHQRDSTRVIVNYLLESYNKTVLRGLR